MPAVAVKLAAMGLVLNKGFASLAVLSTFAGVFLLWQHRRMRSH